MSTKQRPRSWDDLKMLTAALAVTSMLGMWNLFATINKQSSVQKAASVDNPAPVIVESNTQPEFDGKILLGGQPPSQKVVVLPSRANQPAPVTQTRSS